MIEDEFDHYFARAALGCPVDVEIRRGSLPSPTLKVEMVPSGCRRVQSCKNPAQRWKSSSTKQQQPAEGDLLDVSTPGADGEGSDDSAKDLLSEGGLKAPSPSLRSHSAPHSRSASWKKKQGTKVKHPDARPRTGSEPLEEAEVISKLEQLRLQVEEDVCPVRSFTLSSRGLVNQGDSFKRKQGRGSKKEIPIPQESLDQPPVTSSQPSGQHSPSDRPASRVFLLGDRGVGKSALLHQFTTSEYLGASNDVSFDNQTEVTITVCLDEKETTLDFIEVQYDQNHQTLGETDAYVVVCSITDRPTFLHAVKLIRQIRGQERGQGAAVILVANKSELARCRQVSESELRNLCETEECKFIEVSAVLNHRIDDLLVGIVSQIRLNPARLEQQLQRQASHDTSCVSSAKGFLGKLFWRGSSGTQSCDNLLVL